MTPTISLSEQAAALLETILQSTTVPARLIDQAARIWTDHRAAIDSSNAYLLTLPFVVMESLGDMVTGSLKQGVPAPQTPVAVELRDAIQDALKRRADREEQGLKKTA